MSPLFTTLVVVVGGGSSGSGSGHHRARTATTAATAATTNTPIHCATSSSSSFQRSKPEHTASNSTTSSTSARDRVPTVPAASAPAATESSSECQCSLGNQRHCTVRGRFLHDPARRAWSSQYRRTSERVRERTLLQSAVVLLWTLLPRAGRTATAAAGYLPIAGGTSANHAELSRDTRAGSATPRRRWTVREHLRCQHEQ